MTPTTTEHEEDDCDTLRARLDEARQLLYQARPVLWTRSEDWYAAVAALGRDAKE